jgi:competence protein ComEC
MLSVVAYGGELKVHFIDIGQGDSELIEYDGKYMLIDAGDVDKGDEVIDYLKSQNVDKLSYVIATHPHADHIGGMADVINSYDADCFITTSKTATTKCYEKMLKALAAKNISITTPVFGEKYKLGDAEFEIITPSDGTDFGNEANNYSVGIKLTYGNTSFVMCGDAEKEAEQMIVDSGANIKADVLKCGHHGSSTSTSEKFLDKVNPTYAVISCGKDNKYGHPHTETIEKLENRGISYFRTDEKGTIVAVSDGNKIDWNSTPLSGSTGWSQESDRMVNKAVTMAAEFTVPESSVIISVVNAKNSNAGNTATESVDTPVVSDNIVQTSGGYVLNTNTKNSICNLVIPFPV